ncbi:MAG: ABC transporter substrate-binding protein [Chloroflexi bacterium]|nr:MAG: ABC transporter substrate-binding protein [Chloroflexota bacterium]
MGAAMREGEGTNAARARGTEARPNLTRRRFMGLMGAAGGIAAGGGGLAAFLEACSQGATSTTSGSPQPMTMAVFQEPDTLDPAASGLITVGTISRCVFDSLVWSLPKGGSTAFSPGLATSWEVSPDATSYTFHLRQGVKFHDGTTFDANAVKSTFDHIVDPNTKSKGAASALGPYKETQVVDSHTAKVVFESPNAAFMNEVAGFSITSPAALQKYGADFAKNPVGTGPFRFKEYVVGQHVTVERNPDYSWGPAPIRSGPALLSEITFRILSDAGARFNALQTGEVHFAPNLNPQDVASVKSSSQYRFYQVASTGMPWNIMINAQRPPTDDINVRRALLYATDQQAIIKTLYFGLHTAADQVFTPITPGYDSSLKGRYTHDAAKAGQLLDQAGWTKGSNGMRQKGGQPLKLTFINISGFGFDDISQLLQSQYRDAGIQVDISDQSFPAVGDAYNRGDHNLADFFYYDVDPYFVRAIFGADQIAHGFNWEHYANPQLDALVDRANATSDAAARTRLYQQANSIIEDAAVIIPIYNSDGLFVGSSKLKGVQFTVNATPLFHGASM